MTTCDRCGREDFELLRRCENCSRLFKVGKNSDDYKRVNNELVEEACSEKIVKMSENIAWLEDKESKLQPLVDVYKDKVADVNRRVKEIKWLIREIANLKDKLKQFEMELSKSEEKEALWEQLLHDKFSMRDLLILEYAENDWKWLLLELIMDK